MNNLREPRLQILSRPGPDANFSFASRFSTKIKVSEDHPMAAYECEKCGMSIGTMTCGKCNKELVHSTLTTADGTKVHISECPDGHGKVKSPMCCGQDMTCPL